MNNETGMSGDYIVKAMALGGSVRVFTTVTTQTVAEAGRLHDMNPTPCAALGRVLTGIALMSQTLKTEKDTLTVQIRGDGPIGGIVAVTDAQARVRGYAYNNHFDMPLNKLGKFDIGGAVGKGYLNVIKDIGMKEPYIGYVDLVSGEIAEDLAYYYAYSEQIPTVMNLGVLIGAEGKVLAAGGYFIQLMPQCDESVIERIEKRIKNLPSVTAMIHDGLNPEELLHALMGGDKEHDAEDSYEILSRCPVVYHCYCSRERMERNLLSLGRKDLAEIAQDEKGAELHCHFCNKKYHFNPQQLETMLESAR